MKDNVIKTKSFQFAVATVKLYKDIQQMKHEFILSKQLVKSGILCFSFIIHNS
jgi:hypothetical protein